MKIKLTPQLAEEIAKETFSKIEKIEDKDFDIAHSRAVVECSLILAEGKNIDNDILRIAGWVHDVGYIISRENHARHSMAILEKDYEIDEKLKDCILNHGNDGKPETEEGKIIQVADKLSSVNPEIVKTLVRHSLAKDRESKERDLEFIKKMCNRGIDLLKEFS